MDDKIKFNTIFTRLDNDSFLEMKIYVIALLIVTAVAFAVPIEGKE